MKCTSVTAHVNRSAPKRMPDDTKPASLVVSMRRHGQAYVKDARLTSRNRILSSSMIVFGPTEMHRQSVACQ